MVFWTFWAFLRLQDVTFISGATRSFPWGLQHCEQLQMWMAGAGYEGQRAQQFLYWFWYVWVCVCVSFDIREKETRAEDFDLQGSEHEDLPSKKLTSAVQTSKHLFSFYYISRPKKNHLMAVYNASSYSFLHSKASKLWPWFYLSDFSLINSGSINDE